MEVVMGELRSLRRKNKECVQSYDWRTWREETTGKTWA